ncbi:MAG TPA: hypothetical protein VH394_18295 [Thermoanaerobaculia bacterium]|jgi:hypothetical protein|nr:hypothetical protein [Thermoanaerobaculia bacterium]
MSACRRFEDEGLLRLEQGLPLDDHFSTCPDCLAERAAYERLRDAIATAGDGIEPPPGWQAGVWSAIEKRQAARRRWHGWWLLVPAAAAVLLAILLLRPPVRPVAQLALAVEIEAGAGPVRRGGEAHPGDRLRLRATIGEVSNAELRVYRNDRALVLRCSTGPPCRTGDGTLEADFVLPAIGSYQSLLVTSDRPLPEAGAGLDADVAAALAAGARTTLGEEIEAR